ESRELGRIVANPSKETVDRVIGRYAAHLGKALARPARVRATVNALMHVLGFFSDQVTAKEKARFIDAVTEYREGRSTLDAPLEVVRQWVVRFDDAYIANQTFLEPYPRELM
ncbi:MAG: YbgA family protein, partial [Gemmatimonadales bacterium]